MIRFIAKNKQSYDTWRMRVALTLLTFAALAVLPGPASAFDLEAALKEQHVQYQGRPDLRTAQAGCMSLSQAIESVRRRTNGKVVGAETRNQGGREMHYIKVLKDGKVRTHKVNGCSR